MNKLKPNVQFLASRDKVIEHLEKGYTLKDIYRLLFENKSVNMSYSSFQRLKAKHIDLKGKSSKVLKNSKQAMEEKTEPIQPTDNKVVKLEQSSFKKPIDDDSLF